MPDSINEAWEYWEPDPEIAEVMEYHCRAQLINRLCCRRLENQGFELRTTPNWHKYQWAKDEFAALYFAGLSMAEIADYYGTTTETIRHRRDRLGLPKRQPGHFTRAERVAQTAGTWTPRQDFLEVEFCNMCRDYRAASAACANKQLGRLLHLFRRVRAASRSAC